MNPTQAEELERLVDAARDSLTDEMVSRLAGTAAEGVDLIDQVNRSGVVKALPALTQLIENGDLDRLVALARTFGAAQDAVTDEMVSRLAETAAESVALMDRLNRAGLDRVVGSLERLATVLEQTMGALETAKREVTAAPAGGGGIGGLWRLLADPDNQASLRFLLAFARELRKTSR